MRIFAAATLSLVLAANTARADEGMWTFDNFPTAKAQAALGWAPDKAWLDKVRLASARIEGGCSAAIVSGEGLVQTNHHCVISCVQNLSRAGDTLVESGFLAATRAEERVCPGLAVQVLLEIKDVTAAIAAATAKADAANFTRALDAETARLERACKGSRADRACQVVSLYDGGEYKLYTYKRYEDVRLAFAPEIDAAFFGGDPDNFNFPRFCLDVGYLRLYENGRPAVTPNHLKLRATPLTAGEPTVISGNPGTTSRAMTVAELEFQRDYYLPLRLTLGAELRGRLIAFSERGAEEKRIAADWLFGVENGYKARTGRRLALVDKQVFAKKEGEEASFKQRIGADAALAASSASFDEIAAATARYRGFYQRYYFAEFNGGGGTELFGYARTLVRAAAERSKPDAERLREYASAALPRVQAQLFAVSPVEKPLEELLLSFWLSKTRELLTADDPFVRKLLGKESPEQLAARLVAGSRLADPAERRRLWEGGAKAIEDSTDPMIVFARAWDAEARAVRTRYEQEYSGPVDKAHERLAKSRFALYRDSIYPDATFTLRLTYGRVEGWTEPSGAVIAPFTNFAGLAERASGAEPYKLATKVEAAMPQLNPATILNISTTHDIIGGNSGSPLIDTQARVVGAAFDGNIHSLGGEYIYDARLNRTISVASTAVLEALDKVYGAKALVAELTR